MPPSHNSVIALDVGDRRIGIAIASLAAKLPSPLTTLIKDSDFIKNLLTIIKDNSVETIVIGLPRGLNGQQTLQTTAVDKFADELRSQISLPISFQDEAVTSKQAEAELESRHKPYKQGDIDALAATYILEDFLAQTSTNLKGI